MSETIEQLREEIARLKRQIAFTVINAYDMAKEDWEVALKKAEDKITDLHAEIERLKTAMTQAIRQHEEGNQGLSHRTLCDALYGEQ